MKEKIKQIMPKFIVFFIKGAIKSVLLRVYYIHDRRHFFHYSSFFSETDAQRKLIGRISMAYHGIEKGLTMPNRRVKFGKNAVSRTVSLCNLYIKNHYDLSDNQFLHTLGVLSEYLELYKSNNLEPDARLKNKITELFKYFDFEQTKQIVTTKEDYFRYVNSSFDKFSSSRHSIRDFEKNVDLTKIKQSIQLAQNAPSSCNRQASRVHIVQTEYIKHEILSIQRGNNGFGDLADKILIVTAEIGVYAAAVERNAAYIDGGMYGMNLLYALHFNSIAACALNCYFSPKMENKVRKICNIPDSEIFVMIILVGNCPNNISLTLSRRQDICKVYSII
jgi:nitroreductase